MTKGYQNIWIAYVFIAAGIVPIGMAIVAVWNWNLARSWIPTEATVVAVDVTMKSVSGHRGRSSTIAVLSATYEYHWDDAAIRGEAISPFASVEPFIAHKRKDKLKIAAELRAAHSRKDTVMCYVNPNSPNESYLKREFRFQGVLVSSLIGLLFSGGGLAIVRQHWKQVRTTHLAPDCN
ncbi:DUF3592 domain-containing protein [bacterium]|nr:DUF3592 domain-containing protein [bacterium]